MKSFKKLFCIALLALSAIGLVACDKKTTSVVTPTTVNVTTEGVETTVKTTVTKVPVYADDTTLRMAVVHNSTATTISFEDSKIVGSGLTLADGKTYQLHDLKPVWSAVQDVLKVKFTNVYTGATSVGNEYSAWQALNFEGVDVLVGDVSAIAKDGKNNKIVNLADYMDYMPNFRQFLEDNPVVYLSLLSDTETGAIYYTPYFDGYDDIEKYFLMRTDWIELLLDGEGDFSATLSDTFGAICKSAAYTPYMPTSGSVKVSSLSADGKSVVDITKNYDNTYGNIAKYMNDHVTSATTGVELVNMLRKYIDAAYNGLYGTSRSKLFTGYNACWDADELVALLRCVVTNTQALTGQNITKVTGIFPREKTLDRCSDLISIASMFGIRGTTSRNDYLYFDANGNLVDARGDESFVNGVNKLNELYKEGLILQNYDTYSGTIYKDMYQKNLGFMLYDYVQTQTLYNDDKTAIAAAALAGTKFNLAPVLEPVALWYDGTQGGVYQRFTESWRSVKTGGWCIPTTCTGDALMAALKLFDYAYTKEGQILLTYGPEAWRSGKTIDYKGQQVPEMSEAALAEFQAKGKGNFTNYARQYLGSTLPIGYMKDQGFEYQCTSQGGKIGASIVGQAIALGVEKHISPTIGTNMFYTIVPTVLPTTAQQDTLLANYPALSDSGSPLFSKTKNKYSIYQQIVQLGLGSGATLSNTLITTMPTDAADLITNFKKNLGGDMYIFFQQKAWNSLLAYYKANF